MYEDIIITDIPEFHHTPTDDISHEYTLIPFSIEGKLNQMHFEKGWKRRFLVREDENIIHVLLDNNGIITSQALFMIKAKRLYAISGVFQLHWAAIRRIFKEEYGNIEIIGHIL